MKKVAIQIDGVFADLSERDISLAITKSIGEIADVGSRSGSYSFTFRLPKTKVNGKIFKNIDIVQGVNKFDKTNNFEAIVFVDNVEIFSGILKLRKIDYQEYECFLIGNEISWKNLIKNKTLRDIESLPTTPFIGERNKNTGYEPSGTWVGQEEIWQLTSEDYPVQFPLISYGNFFIGNKEILTRSSNSFTTLEDHRFHDGDKIVLLMNVNNQVILYGEDNTAPLYCQVTSPKSFDLWINPDNTGTPTIQGTTGRCKRYDLTQNKEFIEELEFEDIPPSVYVQPIIKSIFKDIDYSVSGKFFNNSDNKKLIVPFTNDRDPIWNWNVLSQFAAIQTGSTIKYYSTGSSVSQNYYTAGIDFIDSSLIYPTLSTQEELYDFSKSFDRDNLKYICPATTEDGNNIEDYQFYVDIDIDYFEKNYTNSAGLNIAKRTGILIYKEDIDQNTFNQVQSIMYDYFINGSSLPTDHPGIVGFYDFGPAKTQFRLSSVTDTVNQNINGSRAWTGEGRVTLLTNNKLIARNSSVKSCLVFARDNTVAYNVGDSNIYIKSGATFSGFSQGDYYLHAEKQLPEVKQIDFIKSVINLFNLYVTVDDKSRVINFDTYDDFYIENEFAIDWTNKTNSYEYSIYPIKLYRSNNFLYQDDSNDILNTNWGNYYLENNSIYATGSQDIKTDFSSTWEKTYTSLISGETINIPTIASEEQLNTPLDEVNWGYDYNQRILYYDGYQSGFTWYHDDVILSGYPKCSFNSGGKNLRYDSSTGLYENYFSNMYYQINNSFYLDVDVNLNDLDMNVLNLRRPIQINNNLFKLIEVSQYRPSSENLTKVKFMKIL